MDGRLLEFGIRNLETSSRQSGQFGTVGTENVSLEKALQVGIQRGNQTTSNTEANTPLPTNIIITTPSEQGMD